MKAILSLILTGVFGIFPLLSSGQQVTSSPYGLYLEIRNNPQLNSPFEVLRADGNSNNFEGVGVFTTVLNSRDLYRRMSEYAAMFDYSLLPTTRLADTLWSIWMSENNELVFQQKSPVIHLALGLSFLDQSAEKGKVYRYQVRDVNKRIVFTTGEFTYGDYTPRFDPMRIFQVDEGESIPEVKWVSSGNNAAPMVDLWRKMKGSSYPFERIHVPGSMSFNAGGDSTVYWFADTTALPGIQYQYFISGRDYLNNIGLPSDTASLQVGGRRNIAAAFNIWPKAVDNGIKLRWDALDQRYSVQNIVVMRSETYDDGYSLLATLPVTDTVYVDYKIHPGKRYYYQLFVQGDASFSFASPRVSGIYYGIARLLPPQNFEIRLEENNPKLTWTYADTTDVRGFYVYRTLSTAQPLEQISNLLPVTDLTYVDTAAAGTTAHYVVAAVSRTQSLSPPSEVMSISIPLKTKIPAVTQLRAIWLDRDRVSITWKDISDTEPGVAGYRVFRRKSGDPQFEEKAFHETLANELVDTIRAGESYTYGVRVVGLNGELGSFSTPLRVDAQKIRPVPPRDLKAFRQDKKVFLIWDGGSREIRQYYVYRSTKGQKPVKIGSVTNNNATLEFADDQPESGSVYYYAISSESIDGNESETSEEIIVEIP